MNIKVGDRIAWIRNGSTIKISVVRSVHENGRVYIDNGNYTLESCVRELPIILRDLFEASYVVY